MQDTIDLIPIGAYYGKGSRAGVFGAYLLASYNKQRKVFEAACKVGTGFSKEQLESLTEAAMQEKIGMMPEVYDLPKDLRLQPDVWLLPNMVWEVSADSLSRSPSYKLARNDVLAKFGQNQGLSLRFPRFLRRREDKELRNKLMDFEMKIDPVKALTDKIYGEYGSDSAEIFRMFVADLEHRQ